ncbi:MAG: hypothetical protein H6985_17485 [Pseudomonadales bacterium]|nr:hypothetical protein [Pseudomonadales bacterium]
MEIAVVVVVIVLAIALFFVLRPSPNPAGLSANAVKRTATGRPAKKGAGGSKVRAAPALNPYRAVSVKCGPGACEAALALGKRRFLTGELKKLPLAGCTSSNCGCTFEHHPDRRNSHDDQRAPASALRSELYAASGKPERRVRRGRRKGDFL